MSLSHQTSAVEHDDSSSSGGGMEALLCLSLTRLALWNTMIAVVLVVVWRLYCVSLSLTRLALWNTMIATSVLSLPWAVREVGIKMYTPAC